MLKTRALLVALLTTATFATAQVTIHSGPIASSGGVAHRNVVQDAQGNLYAIVVTEAANGDRPLSLYQSTDQGQTWQLHPFTVNDATSGLTPPDPTNSTNMTIDDQGRLHIVWGSYYYPSSYKQWYRNVEPATSTASAIVDISAVTFASTSTRTAGMDIVVDAGNTVWIASHGGPSWVEHLIYSAQPYAANGAFVDAGPISPSASAQNSRLAVDANGLIHCGYYRNVSPGNYEHRAYDPVGGTWGQETTLGNTTPTNDYYGVLAADALGNVHALYVQDAAAGSTWVFDYKLWDGNTQTWSAAVNLYSATPAQYTGIASYRTFTMTCDEASGRVTAIYRDLSTNGALRVAQKDLTATAFTNLADLTPASTVLHEYHIPTVRGTLFPTSNRANGQYDITWRQNTAAPYDLKFTSVFDCTGSITRGGTGCNLGSGTALGMTYGGAPCIGQTFQVGSNAPVPLSSFIIFGVSDSLWQSIVLPLDLTPFGAPGCSVYTSQELITGPFPSGTNVPIALPNQAYLIGATSYAQAWVIDPSTGAPLPIVSSDKLTITIGM